MDEFTLPKGSSTGLGPIVNKIKCPVVEQLKRKRQTIEYDPSVKLHEIEKEYILAALKYHLGHMTKTADALGIGRETLYRRIREYRK
jgi:transcriptional regulator of acetoin/glycerol metabolism